MWNRETDNIVTDMQNKVRIYETEKQIMKRRESKQITIRKLFKPFIHLLILLKLNKLQNCDFLDFGESYKILLEENKENVIKKTKIYWYDSVRVLFYFCYWKSIINLSLYLFLI